MNLDQFYLESEDKKQIFYYKWHSDEPARGVVQIAHGMAEHAFRYNDFAGFLVKNNYIVYANDHRGHGRTEEKTPEYIGYLAPENGWSLLVKDFYSLTKVIKKENPELPVFLFGHSMGSLIVRDFISRFTSEIQGIILSGTPNDPGIMADIAIFIANLEIFIKGDRKKSPLLDRLSFGKYNSYFKPNRTPYDFLSRDNSVVDKYVQDEFCGEIFTNTFFRDMLGGIKQINRRENIAKISKNLPVLFISGENDPVTEKAKGVNKIYQYYKKQNLEKLEMKIYSHSRHEILNELNKEEVYNDILGWIEKHLYSFSKL